MFSGDDSAAWLARVAVASLLAVACEREPVAAPAAKDLTSRSSLPAASVASAPPPCPKFAARPRWGDPAEQVTIPLSTPVERAP